MRRGYQTCLIDPEGDYESLSGFLTVGDESHPPSFEQIFQLLDHPRSNLAINLLGVKMHDRPAFFASLLTKLQEKTLREGRPHRLIIDEAHHLLPSEWAPASAEVAGQTASLLLVTVHPEHVSPAALRLMNALVIVGKQPRQVAEEFARVIGRPVPEMSDGDLAPGEASVWFVDSNCVVNKLQTEPSKADRKRHKRKYAEGELEPERIFYFRGPQNKSNLRVQNLAIFVQLAKGIDDETWMFHLERGDYSNWFATSIKDKELAGEIETVERDQSLSPQESRNRIVRAIENKYTAPA